MGLGVDRLDTLAVTGLVREDRSGRQPNGGLGILLYVVEHGIFFATPGTSIADLNFDKRDKHLRGVSDNSAVQKLLAGGGGGGGGKKKKKKTKKKNKKKNKKN